MVTSEYSNDLRRDPGLSNDEDRHRGLGMSKSLLHRLEEEKIVCRCGAKQQVDHIRRELHRKVRSLERERASLQKKEEYLNLKQRRLAEDSKEHMHQQEELDSYKLYLQERHNNICKMYQKCESDQSNILEKMNECILLKEECKKKLAEYEIALKEVKGREIVVSENASALAARKEELGRLEARMLQESEHIKYESEQLVAAKEKANHDIRLHNQKILQETDALESKRNRILEMDNQLQREKERFEEFVRKRKLEIEKKLKDATDAAECNSDIADDLRRREEALRKEKENINEEWRAIKEALRELDDANIQVRSIKRDLKTRHQEPFRDIPARSTIPISQQNSDSREYHMDYNSLVLEIKRLRQLEFDIQEKTKQIEKSEEELRLGQIKLNDFASSLNKREMNIQKREVELEKLASVLDKKKLELEQLQRDLNSKQEKYRQLEVQINEYKEQMALLSIEKNSLEGQMEQFNAKKITKEQELSAIQQRLERKEREINDKFNQLKNHKDHINMQDRLHSIKNTPNTNKIFSIATNKRNNVNHFTDDLF